MGTVWLSKLVFAITILVAVTEAQPEANFKCNTEDATCHALADYSHPNGTTLRRIQTLFTVKHLPDLLGANNFPANTTRVGPNQVVRVPFPCRCRNGTGLSNRVPRYKIKKGDTLYDIATTVFAGLVKYPQIQVANEIPDANNITAGDTIWIPLPCSCDAVDGGSVVHYAHLVTNGSSVESIAQQYGSTQQILLSLNGISDPKLLQAGQLLDVPLQACSSSVKNDSMDYPLLVPNATYAYTANECVKCKCDSSNKFRLQCEPSKLKPINDWSVCPSMECSKNVLIGNITSTDSCNRTVCDYAGYNSTKISTVLATQNTCAVPPSGTGAPGDSGSGGSSGSPDSGASRSNWVWSNNLLIVILFVFYLL